MNDPTRLIADGVRVFMANLARVINNMARGVIKPVHITVLSFLGHIPAAWALYDGRPILAAGLITFFGLMDSLDGALAREQKSASKLGMYFDAVTDRMKEILLYAALIIYTNQNVPEAQPWVIVALAGTSVLVSYVKAKGEMALSDTTDDVQKLNKTFDGGIARYEIRMTLLVIGLLTGLIGPFINFMVALNMITVAIRFMQVSQLIAEQESRSARKDESKREAIKKSGAKKKAKGRRAGSQES